MSSEQTPEEPGLFQQDLERDLDNLEFRAAFVREAVKIGLIDRLVNADDLARALGYGAGSTGVGNET